MKNIIKQLTAIILLNGLLMSMFPVAAFSAMTSTNYTIYADSIGMDGGSLSTSTSYSLQDTVGESPAGQTTSTTYIITGGYQGMDRGLLSVALSSASIDLGTVTPSAISMASTIVTVSSDSATGYTLSIGSAGGSPLTAVSDGAVTAGIEEYGMAASGGQAQITGDVAVAPGLVIASASSSISNSATTLTFKASATNNTQPGTSAQSIVLTATANF